MRCCDTLTNLFLDGNGRVGYEGAKALADAFIARGSAATRLAVLDINDCGITTVGAAMLLATDGAASLSLFGNTVDAVVAGALLAAALAGGGQCMTHVNISGTGLAAEGLVALTAAHITTIRSLDCAAHT